MSSEPTPKESPAAATRRARAQELREKRRMVLLAVGIPASMGLAVALLHVVSERWPAVLTAWNILFASALACLFLGIVASFVHEQLGYPLTQGVSPSLYFRDRAFWRAAEVLGLPIVRSEPQSKLTGEPRPRTNGCYSGRETTLDLDRNRRVTVTVRMRLRASTQVIRLGADEPVNAPIEGLELKCSNGGRAIEQAALDRGQWQALRDLLRKFPGATLRLSGKDLQLGPLEEKAFARQPRAILDTLHETLCALERGTESA